MLNVKRLMPLINGVKYSWSSISFTIAGVPEIEVQAIEYGDKQEMDNIYATGQLPVGRGYGRIVVSASITLLMDAVEAIREGSPTGRLQDIAPFDIIVCYIKPGNPKIVKHVIKNINFMEETTSAKEGDTSIPKTLPLLPSHIIWNAR
jgi:hypothetical protein